MVLAFVCLCAGSAAAMLLNDGEGAWSAGIGCLAVFPYFVWTAVLDMLKLKDGHVLRLLRYVSLALVFLIPIYVRAGEPWTGAAPVLMVGVLLAIHSVYASALGIRDYFARQQAAIKRLEGFDDDAPED
jgi:hypothetical protein